MEAKKFYLVQCLVHPVSQLKQFESRCSRFQDVPVSTWLILTSIAVFGSALYGGSLSLVLPDWQIGSSALVLTLSSGLAWCIFGPILVLMLRKNAYVLAHACLITMAYGEAVLAIGAFLNLLFSLGFRNLDCGMFNIVWIGLSNVIMASALSVQLGALRVPYWKTLLIWMLTLNGSGYLFFLMFKQIIEKIL
jgi:hypothetical protein